MQEERQLENYAIEINTFPEKHNSDALGGWVPLKLLWAPPCQPPESAHPHIFHIYFIMK